MALFLLTACAFSPLGRKQLKLVPDAQMTSLGDKSFKEIKSKSRIEKDERINHYVRCVSTALIHALQGENVEHWDIVVFNDKSANAFALPGKHIGVHTGLLKVAKTPGQLAAVIGHEIGHVLANHGNERVSTAMATQGGIALAGSLFDNKGTGRNLILAALGVGAQIGIELPFSRTQESEADTMGLYLMADAGFDPNESVALWENMSEAGGGQPPEFLSTHPSHSSRIWDLRRNMYEAEQRREKAQAIGRKPICVAPKT